MHKIVLHKNVVRFYESADATTMERISAALDIISKNPRFHTHIKKLKGELKHIHRFRLGGLRIIYEIEEDILTVRIKAIETRGSAYKKTSGSG